MSGALLVALALVGAPPVARHATKVTTSSWEPIALAEIEALIGERVLVPAARDGLLRLEPSGFAELMKGDYALTIEGRFIEEAECFSVYLTFLPAGRKELPSFHVAETVALSKLKRPAMADAIGDAAARAAERLRALLAPRLEALRLSVTLPKVDDDLPTRWGPIELPEVRDPSRAMKTLLDPSRPDHERATALAELAGHAFDQPAARAALLLCLTRDPAASLRARCGEALEPIARTHVPTQRVVLHAMRAETDEAVLRALAKLSANFVGLSRKESIETWLGLLASDATPVEAAGELARLVADEGDVPNLDLALARCLRSEVLAYGRRSACASSLFRPIPRPRAVAIALAYLEGARVFGQGERMVFEDVLEAAAGRGSEPLDPGLAEALLRVAERPSAGAARRMVLYPLRRHPPSLAAIERLLALVPDPELAVDALRTIGELAEADPGLARATIGALTRLGAEVRWLPKVSRENPYEALTKTIRALERKAG